MGCMNGIEAPRDIGDLNDRVSAPSEGVVESLRTLDGDVLVLGAGGKMGLHLCLMLRKAFGTLGKDNRVLGVSRFGDAATRRVFESAGIDTIPCDLTSREDLEKLPEAKHVFFLAGIKFGTSGAPELLHKMNVEMPSLVAERFQDAAIVALSTGCVYPYVNYRSGGARETDAVSPVGDYASSCLGREQAFTKASEKSGQKISLIRLNYSVDLRYGVLVDIAQKVMRGSPVDVTMGYVNVIWQGDALSYIIQALPHCAAPPFILNVTGAAILPVREAAGKFGRLFGKKATITGEEAATAWLSDGSKSYALFGRPSVTEDELIEMVAEWLRQGGETLGKPTHFQTRDGKF